MQYCGSPFRYQRRKTREVIVGDPANGGVIIGGDHPVVAAALLVIGACGGSGGGCGGGGDAARPVVIPKVAPGEFEAPCADLCTLAAGDTACTAKHAEFCVARCRW